MGIEQKTEKRQVAAYKEVTTISLQPETLNGEEYYQGTSLYKLREYVEYLSSHDNDTLVVIDEDGIEVHVGEKLSDHIDTSELDEDERRDLLGSHTVTSESNLLSTRNTGVMQ